MVHIRFFVVSLLNTVVELVVFNALLHALVQSDSVYAFVLIKSVSFFTAVTHSYFWNMNWTFAYRRETESQFSKFGQFLGVNLVSFSVNLIVATLSLLLLQNAEINYFVATNLATLLGSASGMVINFKGYKKLFI